MATHTLSLTLLPDNALRLSNLCGRLNEHIHQIEAFLSLNIQQRGNIFQLSGTETAIEEGSQLLESLYASTAQAQLLSPKLIYLALQELEHSAEMSVPNSQSSLSIKTPKTLIKPRSIHQQEYVRNIQNYDISFAVGPAGTGKTYLAVACAVEALVRNQIDRILLVRPAVEAGEKLGFLPGDLAQKVDPYLRPLYDALYEMLGFEKVARLIEKNIIEVAPLAYMRGRTLNNSFIILDESQNTTATQMKMFLTRIGFGSTAVITGDITQIDLPKGERSGLVHVTKVLEGINEIGFTYFTARDVMRHLLVRKIVEAYDEFDRNSVSQLSGQEASQLNERES